MGQVARSESQGRGAGTFIVPFSTKRNLPAHFRVRVTESESEFAEDMDMDMGMGVGVHRSSTDNHPFPVSFSFFPSRSLILSNPSPVSRPDEGDDKSRDRTYGGEGTAEE